MAYCENCKDDCSRQIRDLVRTNDRRLGALERVAEIAGDAIKNAPQSPDEDDILALYRAANKLTAAVAFLKEFEFELTGVIGRTHYDILMNSLAETNNLL